MAITDHAQPAEAPMPAPNEAILTELRDIAVGQERITGRLDAAAEASERATSERADLRDELRAQAERIAELERWVAAQKAIATDRAASGEWWSRVGSWVGVGISILFGLGSAAWALFVRGEK